MAKFIYSRDALIKKFNANVSKTSGEECWPWIGATLKGSRGIAWIGTKNVTAPVLSWFVHHNEWPADGIFVCHECDNPNCVNPSHLWLGTNSDNLRDAARKGRLYIQKSSDHIKGSRHGNAKMTEDMVRQMRKEFALGTSTRALARKYGMSQYPVYMAVSGRAWTHVK